VGRILRLLAPLACLLAAFATGASHPATPSGGVLGIDAWAQGDLVDLVTAIDTGAGLELRHARSADGGRTWGTETVVPLEGAAMASPRRGHEPQVAAQGDRVLVSWTGTGTSAFGTGPLHTALSTDGGASWRPGPNPADDGSTDGHGFHDLAVDAGGQFHAVWLDSRDGGQGLRAATSADGSEWSVNATVDPQTCECCGNRLAVGDDGSVHVLYRDKDPRDMAVASRRGDAWHRLGDAGDFDWSLEACPHTGGGVVQRRGGGAAPRLVTSVWTGDKDQVGAYIVELGPQGGADPLPLPDASGKHTDLAILNGKVLVAWEGREGPEHRVRAAQVAADGRRFGPVMALSAAGVSARQPLVVPVAEAFLVLWTEWDESASTSQWGSRRVAILP